MVHWQQLHSYFTVPFITAQQQSHFKKDSIRTKYFATLRIKAKLRFYYLMKIR